MLEIDNDAHGQSSDAKVIEHLSTLMVRNPVDCLGINDQLLLDDEIGNILSNQIAFVQHPMPLLLHARNAAQAKLHAETIFMNLLVQPVSAHIENLKSAADHCVNFFLKNQFAFISVHRMGEPKSTKINSPLLYMEETGSTKSIRVY